MDPLSITVSAASAVSLAIQTISALNNYAMTVKEAPAEVKALIEELQMLTETIHNIEETFKAKAKSSEGSENEVKEADGNLQTLTKAIAGCQAHLAKALAVLDECGMTVTPADEGLNIKTGARYKRLFKRVKYPFNREYIQRLLMVVRDYKATLTLSLSLEGT
ncbi:hypothetical protein UCRPA7_1145 [Phaeoacremonium minimum UCRPA7]|uniref:Fungal N-terminal domain-containing protein n=1 Tax=Phaeoacremonium minimum (strain UCR-PA7) TaxID=1286976 RepID=R8BVH0_PHAM7|nr:hypothetical protein UCRPA7_1145 [Phaeoacremonium minimum UCRPA7]EOO03342.1 hypothetical protein UCRPA7_1145 [Phaeoacremonium minimum UCRPA7]